MEQRDKALMTLHSLYVRGRDSQPTGSYPREPEFWAYSILLKLGGQVRCGNSVPNVHDSTHVRDHL